MATVNLENVNKNQGNAVVLENINLNIEKGEFVAVVGPSGSGKTTLLRLVAGLEQISGGSILINGKCVNNTPPSKRDMAMVFQNYALYPHMTVYANMAYGLKMRGMKKEAIQIRVQEVSKMLKLEEFLLRKPDALSGGQKQRVAMGRAIVRSPAVFLFDEPLSNLDAKLRTEMRHEIKKLHQQLNTTCIYVTHDQTEAMTLADTIVILNKGRIEQVGTPQELYHSPATLFVASFIGTYAMNFINGVIEGGNIICTEVGLSFPLPSHLKSPINKKVTIGIRPEHILVIPKTETVLSGKIYFIEDMGADKLLQVELPQKKRILVRVFDALENHNEQIYLKFNMSKANLFCGETGNRLGGWG